MERETNKHLTIFFGDSEMVCNGDVYSVQFIFTDKSEAITGHYVLSKDELLSIFMERQAGMEEYMALATQMAEKKNIFYKQENKN